MVKNALKFALAWILVGCCLGTVNVSAQDEAVAPADASRAPVDLKLEDPAVRSVIEANPKTPADLVRAITVLVDLDRAELARPLLARLVDAKLDERALAALAEKYDSAVFMKLAGNTELAPQAAQFADAVLSAGTKWRRDPARLDDAISKLADPKEGVRHRAAHQLRAAREAAVAPLLRALADPQRADVHASATAILAKLNTEATAPLSAALRSQNLPIALAAARALGQIRATGATAELLAAAFTGEEQSPLRAAATESLTRILGHRATPAEAREFLVSDIERLLVDAHKHRAESGSTASTWRWDDDSKSGVQVGLPAADLAVETAGRYALALRNVAQDITDQQLFLRAQLTAAKYLAPDQALPSGAGTLREDADKFGPGVIEGILVDALAQGQIWAAAAAVEVLGDVGTEALLGKGSAARSPWAEAARSGDRRLRFAAIDAILRLHPTQRFNGDSSIVDALSFFAATSGQRRALVGHPRMERAQELAGLLAGLGYHADVATNSRQFMELASRSPDYEVALVDVALANPPVDDLIGRLRRDPRTADLPIGVMVSEDLLGAVHRLAASLPGVVPIVRVTDDYSTQFEVNRILQSVGRDHVGHAARQEQAAKALDWLAQLAELPSPLFQIERTTPAVERALYVPALTSVAARVLADLPAASAQQALVQLASEGVLPPEIRRIGAVAFGRNARRYGVHLTSGEIKRQYDRYNASRLADRDSQEILASILDAIEARAAIAAESSEPDKQTLGPGLNE
jgi:hypothetical protein